MRERRAGSGALDLLNGPQGPAGAAGYRRPFSLQAEGVRWRHGLRAPWRAYERLAGLRVEFRRLFLASAVRATVLVPAWFLIGSGRLEVGGAFALFATRVRPWPLGPRVAARTPSR